MLKNLPKLKSRTSFLPGKLCFLLFTVLFCFSFSAQAANTYMVTNLNDSGAGSLRAAISSANGLVGAEIIDFTQGLSGTINVASLMTISDDVTIQGNGLITLS